MRRRETCVTLGAAILSLAAGRAGAMPDSAAKSRVAGDLRRRLALVAPDSARAVARRLPRTAQIGRNPEDSAGLLLAGLGPVPDRPAVMAAIQADFARGQVLRCDGWTISLTEARLCALWR